MRPCFAFLFSALIGCTSSQGGDTAFKEEVRLLIEGLGAEQIEARDIATARLKELLDPTDPDLAKAIMDSDPEVALRARDILCALVLHHWADKCLGMGSALEHEQAVCKMLGVSLGGLEESLKRYRIALEYLENGEIERAENEAYESVIQWRENSSTRMLLNDIGQIRSEQDRSIYRVPGSPIGALEGSEERYSIAFDYFQRGEFERAQSEAYEAVIYWHGNIAARELLNAIRQIRMDGAWVVRSR